MAYIGTISTAAGIIWWSNCSFSLGLGVQKWGHSRIVISAVIGGARGECEWVARWIGFASEQEKNEIKELLEGWLK